MPPLVSSPPNISPFYDIDGGVLTVYVQYAVADGRDAEAGTRAQMRKLPFLDRAIRRRGRGYVYAVALR